MSRGDEKIDAIARAITAQLETGSSVRDVVDKFAAALHQVGLTKEADLIHGAASVLWGQPSDVEQIAAWLDLQAAKEHALLDSGRCNAPARTRERWLVYKASAQGVRDRAWDQNGSSDTMSQIRSPGRVP